MMLEMKIEDIKSMTEPYQISNNTDTDAQTFHGDSATMRDIEEKVSLIIPMSLIVIFMLVEIWPIFYTLDGNFVDIFLKYTALIEQKDLIAPLMLQDINMNEINALNENP